MAEKIDPRRLVERVTALPGYTSSIGTRVVLVDRGVVHLAVERRADLLQFNGYFHGGVITGLADHAAGGAVTTLLPDDRIAITVDLRVNFLRPADSDSIVAKAEVIKLGETISVARVDVVDPGESEAELRAFCVATLRAARGRPI